MRRELTLFAPVNAKVEQRRFKRVVQGTNFLTTIPYADPDDARPADVWKAPDRFHADGERRVPLAYILGGPADVGHVALVHLTEKQHGNMKILRLDPFNLRAGRRQPILEVDESVADRFRQRKCHEG